MTKRKQWLIMLVAVWSILLLINREPTVINNAEINDQNDELEVSAPIESSDLAVIEVVLQNQFIDGRMETEIIEETIMAMEDFWSKYEDYQLIDQKVGEITFRKKVNDISPYLKKVGYFGLNDDMLTIFEGEPEYEQVVQSFYNISVNELSEAEIERLNQGIKIDSKQVYEQTLEVFRDYSPTEQVQG